MRKIKKLLAGILSAAMMLSSMTMTAFAAQTTTPATIDTTQKGSLTIHKYEYNGDNPGMTGTGSENDTVPEGATLLAGAGFTIYKVEELDNYYTPEGIALPNVSTYLDGTGKTIKDEYASKKVGNEVVTETDGIAKFENLELGLYVVIETTTPDAVTSPMKPFIVSIPMTTVDGDDWLYDVHVFPKNGTKYGEVKLEKSGKGGAKLSGVTFALQKKMRMEVGQRLQSRQVHPEITQVLI